MVTPDLITVELGVPVIAADVSISDKGRAAAALMDEHANLLAESQALFAEFNKLHEKYLSDAQKITDKQRKIANHLSALEDALEKVVVR